MHLSLAEVRILISTSVSRINTTPQINLKYINRYHDTWPAAINALNGGILDLKPLITHVFPLEKSIEAMELCSDISRGSIKVQIVDDGEVESHS